MDKRFIEDSFPVFEVSEQSAKEKNIRHGHISTLHTWWARRPLSSSRATNYAALIPTPKSQEEWENKTNIIIEMSKWKNSLNQNIINKIKKDIIDANDGKPPKVLDPFSGGGAIPLESLRLGCECYSNDYNPVAVLIEKCTLEYPQVYGKSKKNNWSESENSLIQDLKKWSNWVFNEAKKEIGDFYSLENDEFIPVGYLWARTVNCQNPSCEKEIPLMRHFWLVKKKNKNISIFPYIHQGKVDFKIVGDGYESFPNNFDPNKGTVSRTVITCPVCGSVISAKDTRKLFKDGKTGQSMVAVILNRKGRKGKIYRTANQHDLEMYESVQEQFKIKFKSLEDDWGIKPVPDEVIPLMSGTFNVPLYGLNTWGDIFNLRQKLMLITFVEKIRNSYELIQKEVDEDYAKVLVTYLAFILDNILTRNNSLNVWDSTRETIANLFGRQALPMTWDYVECNPFSGSTGAWNGSDEWIFKVIDHCSTIENPAKVCYSSAAELPFTENYFDAIFTDPPYYNSVPYADLSDFFYVWLKRSIGDIHPNLFITPLTPKSKEITEMAGWDKERYAYKDKNFFEDNLKKSFQEMFRVLKPGGITTIVYAHKTTDGWETVINALLDSGLTVTASWPISTEMANRLRAKNSAALASSIYIVARKTAKKEIGWFNEVKEEIRRYIPNKLDRLWKEEISGANFFIAAIGSAIEVFGKYDKIMDFEGNEVRADKLLSFVRDVVTDYSVRHILHNGIADELSPLTKFYLLWRWNYQNNTVPFDEARKLAQSAGIDLANEWNKGFIVKSGDKIKVIGPDKRKEKDIGDSIELIDVLHKSLILWDDERKEEINTVLQSTGWGNREAFYKVGQAISDTLPNDNKEKKLLDGFVPTKRKYFDSKGTIQTTLDRG